MGTPRTRGSRRCAKALPEDRGAVSYHADSRSSATASSSSVADWSGWRTWTAAAAVAVAATTAGALWWTGGALSNREELPRRARRRSRRPRLPLRRWTGSCDADHWHRTAAGRQVSTSDAACPGRRPQAHPGKERGLLFPAVFSGRRRENPSGHASVWPVEQKPAQRPVDPRRAWRRRSSPTRALQRVDVASRKTAVVPPKPPAGQPEVAEYRCARDFWIAALAPDALVHPAVRQCGAAADAFRRGCFGVSTYARTCITRLV